MKKLTLFSILLMISNFVICQTNEDEKQMNHLRLQVSADLYSDVWMPWEKYLMEGKDNYQEVNDLLTGFTLELYKPSGYKNINYLAGTTFLRYNNAIEGSMVYKTINENQLIGGGAFIGAEFSPSYKVIGFSIKMAVGYFDLSRTMIRNSANPLDTYTIEKNISSGSLANILQISLNCKLGRLYFIPSTKLIFAGGNQMSVITPGISFGLGYDFKQ